MAPEAPKTRTIQTTVMGPSGELLTVDFVVRNDAESAAQEPTPISLGQRLKEIIKRDHSGAKGKRASGALPPDAVITPSKMQISDRDARGIVRKSDYVYPEDK